MIKLDASERNGDANGFVSRVEEIVNGVMVSDGPSSAYIIKIDNWFGGKWLGFSHKIGGVIEHHKIGRTLTVPPFKPSRVVSEQFFAKDGGSGEFVLTASSPVHIDQFGGANDLRRVYKLYPESALFWWSGRSQANGRGALMAYVPFKYEHYNWYLEMSASLAWRESRFIRITAEELNVQIRNGKPAN